MKTKLHRLYFCLIFLLGSFLSNAQTLTQIMDLTPEDQSKSFRSVAQQNELFYFALIDGQFTSDPTDLWVVNENDAQPILVQDSLDGRRNIYEFEGDIYFQDGMRRLWRTSENSTVQLTDFSVSKEFVEYDNAFYFMASISNDVRELYKIVAGEPVLVASLPEATFYDGTSFTGTVFQNNLYFAYDGGIWYTDGVNVMDTEIKGFPEELHATTTHLYIFSEDFYVYRVNLQNNTFTEIFYGDAAWFTPINDKLIFTDHLTVASEVHAADGNGAQILEEFDFDWPTDFQILNDKVYFIAGSRLWETDGTASGTQVAWISERSCSDLIHHQNELYFESRDPDSVNYHTNIYRFDVNAQEASKVYTFPENVFVQDIFSGEASLMLRLNIPSSGSELWMLKLCQDPMISLGDDFTMLTTESFTFSVPDNFVSVQWPDGSSESSYTFDAANLPLGDYTITVNVVDDNNCNWTDEVVVTIVNTVSTINPEERSKYQIYPNVIAKGEPIYLEAFQMNTLPRSVKITSIDGKLIAVETIQNQAGIQPLDGINFPASGYYFIQVFENERLVFTEKVLVR